MQIFENIKTRRSVRTFLKQPLREESVNFINKTMEEINESTGPFGNKIHLLLRDMKNQKKVGTYGIIKNPASYIVGTVKHSDNGLLDFGYLFEKLVLALNERHVGTCWMAGTFKRDDLNIETKDLIPAVTPIGHYENSRVFESLMRKAVKSDLRVPFKTIFFDQDFDTPLEYVSNDKIHEALEAVRLGPSASNKQPWRILYKDNACHLYLEENKKYNQTLSFKVQYIDMGIAMYHLESVLVENDIEGQWIKEEPAIDKPNDNYIYIATYK